MEEKIELTVGCDARQQFYTMREVARTLGVTTPTISKAIKDGKIPAVRLFTGALIPRKWFDAQVKAINEQLAKAPNPFVVVVK